jgi:hypothetical protein
MGREIKSEANAVRSGFMLVIFYLDNNYPADWFAGSKNAILFEQQK